MSRATPATVEDALLYLGIPALADRLTGKVNHCVASLDRFSGRLGRRRIPLQKPYRSGLGRMSSQNGHRVSVRLTACNQAIPNEARGAGKSDFHCVDKPQMVRLTQQDANLPSAATINEDFMRALNRARLLWGYLRGKSRLNGLPVEYIVETTAKCNLYCPMCPRETHKQPKEDMTDEIFTRLVSEAGSSAEHMMLIGLGEPLLDPKIFDRIEYLRDAQCVDFAFHQWHVA